MSVICLSSASSMMGVYGEVFEDYDEVLEVYDKLLAIPVDPATVGSQGPSVQTKRAS